MKELLILAVVTAFTLLIYYLVEPFAHSKMGKHIESEGFVYKDIPKLTKKGDVLRGESLVMGAGACSACHSIKVAGVKAFMDPVSAAKVYGVNPPDLSNFGSILSAEFMAAVIKNPAHALMVEHNFDAKKGKPYPMRPFLGAGGDKEQEVADMVAYLQSIAKKGDELTPAVVFEDACGRCHATRYNRWTQIGYRPLFKEKEDALAFDMKLLQYQKSLTKYMGTLPQDLSMYIRSRNEHYLKTFIENPQNYIKGTSMPRVGLNADSADKIIKHLKNLGDPLKKEREETAKYVMIYLFIFAVFAILWKREVWRDLH